MLTLVYVYPHLPFPLSLPELVALMLALTELQDQTCNSTTRQPIAIQGLFVDGWMDRA